MNSILQQLLVVLHYFVVRFQRLNHCVKLLVVYSDTLILFFRCSARFVSTLCLLLVSVLLVLHHTLYIKLVCVTVFSDSLLLLVISGG